MNIGGFQKTSLIDYPGKICAIVFTQGCNFRCPYCHNPELVDPKQFQAKHNENEVLKYLKERIGKLDAVTITGGEPTLQVDLEKFIEKLKNLGYLIKLDSNGTNPKILENIISKNLVDYIAMDIKAPIAKYENITRVPTNVENIKTSIELIKNSGVDYEFRTTIVNHLLNHDDIIQIGKELDGAKRYFLQNFIYTKTLNPEFSESKTMDREIMDNLKQELQKYIEFVDVR